MMNSREIWVTLLEWGLEGTNTPRMEWGILPEGSKKHLKCTNHYEEK